MWSERVEQGRQLGRVIGGSAGRDVRTSIAAAALACVLSPSLSQTSREQSPLSSLSRR